MAPVPPPVRIFACGGRTKTIFRTSGNITVSVISKHPRRFVSIYVFPLMHTYLRRDVHTFAVVCALPPLGIRTFAASPHSRRCFVPSPAAPALSPWCPHFLSMLPALSSALSALSPMAHTLSLWCPRLCQGRPHYCPMCRRAVSASKRLGHSVLDPAK